MAQIIFKPGIGVYSDRDYVNSFVGPIATGGATNVTVIVSLLAAAASLLAPTISTQTQVTVTPTVLTATATLLAPSVLTGTNVTVTPTTLAATARQDGPENIFLLHADSALTDATGNYSAMPEGTPAYNTSTPKFGSGALNLNGAWNVSYSGHTIAIGTGEFTHDFWYRRTSAQTESFEVAFSWEDNNTGLQWFIIATRSTGAVYLNQHVSPGVGKECETDAGLIKTGVWQHIAICNDAGTIKCYVDGVRQTSFEFDSTGDYTSVDTLFVGSDAANGTRTLAASIDEYRISPVCIWRGNFTPPQSPDQARQQPIVIAQQQTTIAPAALAATATLNAPTVVTSGGVTVLPSILDATATLNAPTISTQAQITVTPSALAAAATLNAPNISTGVDALVTPTTFAATATIQAPTVSTVQNTTVQPAALAATANLNSPTILAAINTSVSVGAVGAMAYLGAPAVAVGVTVYPEEFEPYGAILAPTVVVALSVVVEPETFAASATVLPALIPAYARFHAYSTGWHIVTEAYVYQGTQWVAVHEGFIFTNGAWFEIFTA